MNGRMNGWVVALVLGLFGGLNAAEAATEYDDVVFPQGDISFADTVVDFEMGDPEATHANFTDPDEAIGPPDYTGSNDGTGSVSLGSGGVITLEFTDNVLTGSGDSEEDLHIFEVGSDVEDTFVDISKNGTDWFDIGKVSGSTSGIDIDSYGFGIADEFSFVRLTDDPDEGNNSGDTVGADIDAVGAISTVATPVPEPASAAMLLTGIVATLVHRRPSRRRIACGG